MKRLNLFKYGLTALMMAFAMTLCYSCSSDDDEETNQEVNPPSNGDSKINGHDYVELAGIKWATENVGEVERLKAIAKDSIYGYYYTQSAASRAARSWGKEHGYGWKLPTEAQWQKLIDECDWEWTEDYDGKKGYIVRSKDIDIPKWRLKYYIFLPVAGYYNGIDNGLHFRGKCGLFCTSDKERLLYFLKGNKNIIDNYEDENSGMSVRPVAN